MLYGRRDALMKKLLRTILKRVYLLHASDRRITWLYLLPLVNFLFVSKLLQSPRLNAMCLFLMLCFISFNVQAAVVFDNVDDSVRLTNESVFDFDRLNPWTVAVWINRTTQTSEDEIFVKYAVGYNTSWGIFLTPSGSCAGCVHIVLTNASGTNGIVTQTNAGVITTGQWMHLAVTYSGSSTAAGLTVYANGTSQTNNVLRNDLTGTILNNTVPWIGDDSQDATCCVFDGSMSDMRVYNRALSAAEVKTLSDSKLKGGGIVQGLVAYYPMDDRTHGASADGASIIKDVVGGNHATGDNGANNTGLTFGAETVLTYPPSDND